MMLKNFGPIYVVDLYIHMLKVVLTYSRITTKLVLT